MSPPLITLTTDFGRTSPYVAVMKGVILSINPAANIVDLSHDIRPQDVRHASYFLGTAVPYFPPGTIHVCVVDPGVGSVRAALYAETPDYADTPKKQRLVGPDNGVFSRVFEVLGYGTARRLANSRFWRTAEPCDTFHGRDVFAPVAAHLSAGASADELGPDDIVPVRLPRPSPIRSAKGWSGWVQFTDDFGNIITDLPVIEPLALPIRVTVNGSPLGAPRRVRTYSEAAPGELVCLGSSDGYFELAEVNGDAARRLNVRVGDAIELEWD